MRTIPLNKKEREEVTSKMATEFFDDNIFRLKLKNMYDNLKTGDVINMENGEYLILNKDYLYWKPINGRKTEDRNKK